MIACWFDKGFETCTHYICNICNINNIFFSFDANAQKTSQEYKDACELWEVFHQNIPGGAQPADDNTEVTFY